MMTMDVRRRSAVVLVVIGLASAPVGAAAAVMPSAPDPTGSESSIQSGDSSVLAGQTTIPGTCAGRLLLDPTDAAQVLARFGSLSAVGGTICESTLLDSAPGDLAVIRQDPAIASELVLRDVLAAFDTQILNLETVEAKLQADLADQLDTLAKALQTLQDALAKAQQDLYRETAALADLQARVDALRKAISVGSGAPWDKLAQLTQLIAGLVVEQSKVDASARRVTDLQAQIDALTREMAAKRQQAEAQRKAFEAALKDLQEKRAKALGDLARVAGQPEENTTPTLSVIEPVNTTPDASSRPTPIHDSDQT